MAKSQGLADGWAGGWACRWVGRRTLWSCSVIASTSATTPVTLLAALKLPAGATGAREAQSQRRERSWAGRERSGGIERSARRRREARRGGPRGPLRAPSGRASQSSPRGWAPPWRSSRATAGCCCGAAGSHARQGRENGGAARARTGDRQGNEAHLWCSCGPMRTTGRLDGGAPGGSGRVSPRTCATEPRRMSPWGSGGRARCGAALTALCAGRGGTCTSLLMAPVTPVPAKSTTSLARSE